jgi:hypothetical protein
MNTKTSLLALVALTALPFSSHSQPGDAAVDSCVKSFVEAYLPGHPVKQVKKVAPPESPLDAFYAPRQYTIAMSARGARTGELFAQARCVASRNGLVLVLDSPSTDAYVARADFVVSLR